MPQQRLLNSAELFVTHAGYSSVREALTAGVPMVCLPLFADQPHNAARVEELRHWPPRWPDFRTSQIFRTTSYPLCDDVLVLAKTFDGIFVRLETWQWGRCLLGRTGCLNEGKQGEI